MTIASRNCQDRLQRLRGWGMKAPLPSGSQLPSPRTLRPGRPSGLNMPHPTRPGVQGYAQVLAAPAMGQRAAVKRWHTAQIAASKRWKCLNAEPLFLFRHPSEGWGPACFSAKKGGGMPVSLPSDLIQGWHDGVGGSGRSGKHLHQPGISPIPHHNSSSRRLRPMPRQELFFPPPGRGSCFA